MCVCVVKIGRLNIVNSYLTVRGNFFLFSYVLKKKYPFSIYIFYLFLFFIINRKSDRFCFCLYLGEGAHSELLHELTSQWLLATEMGRSHE